MKIAVLGDLHYPSIYNEDGSKLADEVIEARNRFFKGVLDQFFKLDVDHYVSIGDLTNYGRRDEFTEVFDLIGDNRHQFTLTLGNHDLYTLQRTDIQELIDIQYNRHVETEYANFLFLETAREMDPDNWSGTLSADQLNELEKVVQDSGNNPLFIFGHHPVYGTTAKSTEFNLSIDPNIPVWDILSQKAGKGYYICGHNHEESISDKDNWQFLQLASAMDEANVYVLELNEGAVSLETAKLFDGSLERDAETVGDGIKHFTLAKLDKVKK